MDRVKLFLINVDDIIVIVNDNVYIQQLIEKFHKVFTLKDLGDLTYFRGLEVTRIEAGFHLYQ